MSCVSFPDLRAAVMCLWLPLLAAAYCGPGEPPAIFQEHQLHYFEAADVYGEVVWKGVLNPERAVMYSAYDSEQLPAARTYFKIVAAESVSIAEFFEGRPFQGSGLKLREIAAPDSGTQAAAEFAALEERLLERMRSDPGPLREIQMTREAFVSRDPFSAFELLIASDQGKSYNLFAEQDQLGSWWGWAEEAMSESPGPLEIAPLGL